MVTYTVDAAATIIPTTAVSVPSANYTDISTLPQFNPALGTLTDATFSYNYAAAINVGGGGGAVGQINGELFLDGNDTGLAASGGGFGPGGVSAFTGSFSGTYDDPNLSEDIGSGSTTFAWDTTNDYIKIRLVFHLRKTQLNKSSGGVAHPVVTKHQETRCRRCVHALHGRSSRIFFSLPSSCGRTDRSGSREKGTPGDAYHAGDCRVLADIPKTVQREVACAEACFGRSV